MADWIRQNPAELADQVDQFVTALNNPAGMAASTLIAANFTDLIARVGTLRASTDDKFAKGGAYEAAVQKELDDVADLTAPFRQYGRQANNAQTMTDLLRGAAGLTIKDTEPSPRDLPLVVDLAVNGRQSGNNFLDWSAASAAGVGWQVETAPATGGPWTIIGTTTGTFFVHENAGAGVRRLYRVLPTRGSRVGEPSNEAAVY